MPETSLRAIGSRDGRVAQISHPEAGVAQPKRRH